MTELDIKNLKIYYDANRIQLVLVKGRPLDSYFTPFNELNYHCIQDIIPLQEVNALCNEIFDTTPNINDVKLAIQLSDHLFERFTPLWTYYLQHNRHSLGAKLWLYVYSIVLDWERNNSHKIHKGTPYFFLGETYIRQGNIDAGFTFIYNALEEDKTASKLLGKEDLYKTLPAYLFCSLIDNPNNHMYEHVLRMRDKIDKLITNSLLVKRFNINDFDKKFLQNDKEKIEDEKFFFVYCLQHITNQDAIPDQVKNNDFSKLRNLDIISNLCVIIEGLMKNKLEKQATLKLKLNNKKYLFFSDYIDYISKNEYQNSNAKAIYEQINFENFDNAVETCLKLNYHYNSQKVDDELLTLILSLGLRNYSAHNTKIQNVLLSKYSEIIQALMTTLLIVLEKLYS
jgi:hypothetical protein